MKTKREDLIKSVMGDNSLQQIMQILQGLTEMQSRRSGDVLAQKTFQQNEMRNQFDMKRLAATDQSVAAASKRDRKYAKSAEKRAQAQEDRAQKEFNFRQNQMPLQQLMGVTDLINRILGGQQDRNIDQAKANAIPGMVLPPMSQAASPLSQLTPEQLAALGQMKIQ